VQVGRFFGLRFDLLVPGEKDGSPAVRVGESDEAIDVKLVLLMS
jgi:hypothetical protein